jgi:hypothetical protein
MIMTILTTILGFSWIKLLFLIPNQLSITLLLRYPYTMKYFNTKHRPCMNYLYGTESIKNCAIGKLFSVVRTSKILLSMVFISHLHQHQNHSISQQQN